MVIELAVAYVIDLLRNFLRFCSYNFARLAPHKLREAQAARRVARSQRLQQKLAFAPEKGRKRTREMRRLAIITNVATLLILIVSLFVLMRLFATRLM